MVEAKYAYFQEENNQIVVKLDRKLTPQIDGSKPCSGILSKSTIQKIGNDSKCTIDVKDPSALLIKLNKNVREQATSLTIEFLRQTIFSMKGCNRTGLKQSSIEVDGLLAAQVVKNAPPSPLIITAGDDLPVLLDLRPFYSQRLMVDSLSVNITGYNPQTNQVFGNATLTNDLRSALINEVVTFYEIVPSTLRDDSQYSVAIGFNNLFSRKITAKFKIFKGSQSLPRVYVEGGLLQYWHTWQDIILRVVIEEPFKSVQYSPQNYNVQWNDFQSSNNSSLSKLLPSTNFFLRIPPFTLNPGFFGLVLVTVTNTANQILYQGTIRLAILSSPIQYNGLKNLQISYWQDLIIDVGSYFDPDKGMSKLGNAVIHRKCIDYLGFPCRSKRNSTQILPLTNLSAATNELVIPAEELERNYTLVLGIEFAAGFFCFEGVVLVADINYTQGTVFEVTILEGQNSFNTFNEMLPIWIQLSSTIPVDLWKWTLDPFETVGTYLEKETHQIAVSIVSKSDFQFNCAWLNNSLIAKYQFFINPSPKLGNLHISPVFGTAFETQFLMELVDCDDEHLPLKYNIFLRDPGSEDAWRLSHAQSSPKFTTLLPIGSVQNNYQLWIEANISDSLDSTAVIKKRIYVNKESEFQIKVLNQMSQANPSLFFPLLSLLAYYNQNNRLSLPTQITANALANLVANLDKLPPLYLSDVFLILKSLTRHSENFDQNLVVNIANSLPSYLTSHSPRKVKDSSLLVLETLSNLLKFVKTDCQQRSVLNQKIFNSSIEVINILTSSFMASSFSWEKTQNLSSELVTLYGKRLNSLSQANELIKVNNESPLIQLNASSLFLSMESNGSQYTLQILILDTQLTDCVKKASDCSEDITEVMITINSSKNGTSQKISQEVPFTIYYPSENSSASDPCIEGLGCILQSPSVNVKGKVYTSCACNDINTFSIREQLIKLFKTSNWDKITAFEGFQSFNPMSSSVFYILLGSCCLTIVMCSLGIMWDAKKLLEHRSKRTRLTTMRKICECYAVI